MMKKNYRKCHIWKNEYGSIEITAPQMEMTEYQQSVLYSIVIISKNFAHVSLAFQVLQRIDDVSLMCDKRVTSLKKLAQKPPRPVQTVTPEPAVPLQPPGGAPHPFRHRKFPHNRVS
jgi:hypothetical protein